MTEKDILIIGTGRMARAYMAALLQLEVGGNRIQVMSRDIARAEALARSCGGQATDTSTGAPIAIVAVTPERLQEAAREAAEAGAMHVLVEKPGALSSTGLLELEASLSATNAFGYLAMNRRFYPSVQLAERLLKEDGGGLSCAFEFTDLECHVASLMAEAPWRTDLFERWGLINPVHVIDLAFFLCGGPSNLCTFRAGKLPWHTTGSEFSGAGITNRGVTFSYFGSFGGAGRWKLDITTPRRRLQLCPLETLGQQEKDSFALQLLDLPCEPPGLKPGLHGLLCSFLTAAEGGSCGPLPSLKEGAQTLAHVERIFGYPTPAQGGREH